MRRIVVYVLILAGLLFVPLKPAEIANLEPVQAVWMYEKGGKVFLETDTQDRGSGGTVEEALANMKKNSAGIIYLDTAEFLFISESAQQQIPAMRPLLKRSVRLCIWEGHGDFADAVKYADAHKIGIKIKNWLDGVKLPNLPI